MFFLRLPQVLLSFYGIATVLDTSYDAKMPHQYTDWVTGAFGWARMDWTSAMLPSECTPFSTGSSFRFCACGMWFESCSNLEMHILACSGGGLTLTSLPAGLVIKGLLPLFFILVVMAFYSARKAVRLGWSVRNLYLGGLESLPLALIIAFAACPSISSSIFQSWLCVEYQYDGSNEDDVSFYGYLRSEVSIRCSDSNYADSEHDTITSIAYALIFVWPVGMVVVFAAVLLPCRHPLHSRTQTPLTRATRFLHKDYHVDYFYWEIVELFRRTVLVGWVLLIPNEKMFLRLVVALLLSIASLALLLSVSPYKRPEDTVLAAGCQLTLIFAFVGGTYIRLFHEFELVSGTATTTRIMVFTSTSAVAMPLVFLTLAMAMLMLWITAALVRAQEKLPSIRLSSTNMPPELTLEKQQKWHLFLSHVWSTGTLPPATQQRAFISRLLLRHTSTAHALVTRV